MSGRKSGSRSTVLTGVNGSGKSHLVGAIAQRSIRVEDLDDPVIVAFNYETFKLENEVVFNGNHISNDRDSAWSYLQEIKGQARNWRAHLEPILEELSASCRATQSCLWDSASDEVAAYRRQVTAFFSRQSTEEKQYAPGLLALAKRVPCCIDQVEHDDFSKFYRPFGLKKDFLPLYLGKVFWDYWLKYNRNQMHEFQNVKNGKSYPAMSEDEFFALHGPPPWDLVNKILGTFDSMKYCVNSPEGEDPFGRFQLKLKHTETAGLEIDFDSLSSGERVLMALVASIYKASSDRHFPDLLLLDEVDASLHPSMMQNMLDVINDMFLAQEVRVLLVTHSPTTIALAPEESIYVMNRSGPNRIEKKAKRDALSILTEGFATLEEGLTLSDQVARCELNIITEGRNTELIAMALRLNGIVDVGVLKGVEGVTGKNQLRIMFEFFARMEHRNKVLFVWDCDAAAELRGLVERNNTYMFCFPKNEDNTISEKGIENAFPSTLFDGFQETTELPTGQRIERFDKNRKKDFETHIISRNNIRDFAHFQSLIMAIQRVRGCPLDSGGVAIGNRH